ncbi:MAG: Alpha/Beta hydrolase protein [Monoraphidium minutum]|nr:MAG: Alpha/Beta hydrolase protein [Monoraphidium minutum]
MEKQQVTVSRQAGGLLSAVVPVARNGLRRSQQLARRLNAGVAAAGHSLRVLSGAWAPPAGAAAAAAAAVAPTADADQNLVLALDWKASLTFAQEVICWHTAGAICCVAYALTAPAAFSVPYATCMGVLFGVMLVFMRSSMMEVLYKAKERFETDLGDPDSRFHTHNNLQVHVKVKAPAAAGAGGAPAAALHCYHGFGSNTWSWSLVQQQLADRLNALVTAHDMPGFGLTERPSDLSGYYLAFNGRLGRLVMDYELMQSGGMSASEAARAEGDGYPHASLHAAGGGAGAVGSATEAAAEAKAAGLEGGSAGEALAAAAGSDAMAAAAVATEIAASAVAPAAPAAAPASAAAPPRPPAPAPGAKRVLVGHSLGGACAALEAVSHPTDYSALVFVSPAILVGMGVGGGKQTWLEQLHDDSALTRAHGAPGGGAAPGGSATSQSSSELDAELADAAAAAGGLAPGAAPSGGGAAAGGGGYTARVPGSEVAYYVARGTLDEAVVSPRAPGVVGQMFGRVAGLLQTTMLYAVIAIILLLRPLVLLGLRAAVRSREFWRSSLQQAYYDKTKVSPECVDAYRLPQLVKGWESGMVRFLLARLGARGSGGAAAAAASAGAAAGGGLEDAGLAQRLAAAVAKHKIPVLIVHGAGDKLIPVSNTLNLARMLPGARVAIVKRSGHCPQEEVPEGFLQIVDSFLAGVVAA